LSEPQVEGVIFLIDLFFELILICWMGVGMAFEELLEWSSGRSSWQQDTMRRLAVEGELTPEDQEDIRHQIEHACGLPVEFPTDGIPLDASHLNNGQEEAQPKTVWASLGPVEGVDRLTEGQPPLNFIVNGVTLIYGANACGKSGYCRIAKQLCRSQSPVELKGNVYSDAPANPAKIALAYREGDSTQPKTEMIWESGTAPPRPLSRLSVFDTASARVYVDKKRKIEFLPFELDLMNKLGLACRAFDGEFLHREETLDRVLAVPLPSNYSYGTEVFLAVAKLVPDTVLADLPSADDLRALGQWSDADEADLAEVSLQLEKDPEEQARLRTAEKRALEAVRSDLAKGLDSVSDEAILALLELKTEADAKSKAVEVAAQELFAKQPISEIGSETWRQMLSYAREFAATIYMGREPPEIATGDHCVLCQQELSDDAALRLKAFDEFIVGRATEDAAKARTAFTQRQNAIFDTSVMAKTAIETFLSGYSAQSDAASELAKTIAIYGQQLSGRLAAVKAALREENWNALDNLSKLGNSPIQDIDIEIDRLQKELVELQKAERDEDALAKLRARQAELKDQKQLAGEIEVVVERRNRLEERCRVKSCRKECASNTITRRITTRRREILTPSLRAKLENELENLKLAHLPIDLADRGDGAESIIEVALTAQQRIANNSDILSEGEQRALALACFLAEADEIGTTHGIIVDDPVSSLDHTRMEAVAKRLAGEAKKGRQIIIFTHSILFHYMMVTEARRALVAWHTEWMSSLGNDRFGLIDESQKPWHLKKVPERLNDIAVELAAMKKAEYDPKDQNFRTDVISLYTRMRETWERVIEEVLLNGVIQRFRPEVMTMRLEAACFDPKTDYPHIFEGMGRCSHYSGHDRAADLPDELPQIETIEADVANLKGFCDAARERQKKLDKGQNHEKGVVPEFA